ncbi:MAG TPA: tripartite tricarboxylate transporter TctB family protein [Chloroflexota bacterium]|nr:tripartite tricarboxylate transporter TctB family protein [Chloroflexota bacterium]
MRKGDLVISAFLFLMGWWVLWQATMLPHLDLAGPGPEFVPNLVGGMLVVLAGIMFVNTWRGSAVTPEGFIPDRAGIIRVVTMVVGLFFYVTLLEVVGYLVLTFIYTFYTITAMSKYRWYTRAIVAAVITVTFYQGFVGFLEVPLPRGSIFGGS